MKRSGEIVRVMYPEDSDKTSVILKKMLLSSLSSNLRMTDKQKQDLPGRRWGYKINETSHEGTDINKYILNFNILPCSKPAIFFP